MQTDLGCNDARDQEPVPHSTSDDRLRCGRARADRRCHRLSDDEPSEARARVLRTRGPRVGGRLVLDRGIAAAALKPLVVRAVVWATRAYASAATRSTRIPLPEGGEARGPSPSGVADHLQQTGGAASGHDN